MILYRVWQLIIYFKIYKIKIYKQQYQIFPQNESNSLVRFKKGYFYQKYETNKVNYNQNINIHTGTTNIGTVSSLKGYLISGVSISFER